MKLKFYGTRGSAPVCEAGFQEFGGNTTCVRLAFPDTQTIAILDAGTGIRNLGKDLLAMGHQQAQLVIAFSHFHWDHIQGFPFFAPAYDVAQTIVMLAMGQGRTIGNLREIFEVQMQAQYFPVQLAHMGATFEFLQIEKASEHFTGVNNTVTTVTATRQQHPGGSYGYRIERGGKVLVFCTDLEHGERIDPQVVALARGADLLVHEAQYTTEELHPKRAGATAVMCKRSRWRRWRACSAWRSPTMTLTTMMSFCGAWNTCAKSASRRVSWRGRGWR